MRRFILISLHMCAASVELVSSGLACYGVTSSLNTPTSGHTYAPPVENSSNYQLCCESMCVRCTVMNMLICVRTAQLSSSFRVALRSTGVPCMVSRSRISAASVTGCSARQQIFVHTCAHIRVNVHFSVPSVVEHSHIRAPLSHTCDAT